jgi:phage gp46-like protein
VPWDLQISNFSDIVFGPSRDWQPITGEDLLKQRIMLRLRMQRGSWILDDTHDLGSNLHLSLRMQQPIALEELDTLVAEALEPMSDEITISDIEVKPSETDERAVDLLVKFRRVLPPEAQVAISPSQILLPVIISP